MDFENEPIVWRPDDEAIRASRLGQFLQHHGLDDLQALRDRADRDPEWFWEAVVRMLDWPFATPYEKVMDVSRGIQFPQFFVGGTSNLALAALDRHVEQGRAEKVALVEETEDGRITRWTYRDLKKAADALAHGLEGLGVTAGDRVAVYLPMGKEAVTAMMACAKLAAIVMPVFSGYGASAMATRLHDAGAKVVITADGFTRRGRFVPMLDTARKACSEVPTVDCLIVVDRAGTHPTLFEGEWDYQQIVEAAGETPYPTRIVPSETPLLLIYTSGTTGKPKGAIHPHLGFPLKATQDLWHAFDLRQDDVFFWYTDMGWMMGPWMVYGGLITGATLMLYDGTPDFPDAGRLWDMISRHQVTVFGISPTAVRGLMAEGDEFVLKHDLSSLRILGSSGEPWNPGPWRWFFDKVGGGRCPIINYSGGTEISGGILSAFATEPQKACAFNGPLPGIAADVVGDNGDPVRQAVGELVIKNPWPGMTRGFWQNPDRYLDAYWSRWPDIWVHGDFAYVDAEGFWYILGRSDDTIKVAGKRLGPAEVESVLVSHPDVTEAAAIGVPDDVKGESLVCFVVAREKPGLEEELALYVAEHMGKALRPQAVHRVRELPKTRNGKVVRRVIRASYLGESPGDLSSLENVDAVEWVKHTGRNQTHDKGSV
ncbi:AMP-binding protein [Sulfobacillus harzensis]|uniref:acetate--CoA ligase n=1 Tax=Sulfobacillus harzensis TaxID=2729629 RepID=A0A7Y0L778_9FIRM|nr:AMP-binding protein [Sulfobacillus harzensis]NMP24026.1 AMP-binding protein [Sulfobacillus harzensis]